MYARVKSGDLSNIMTQIYLEGHHEGSDSEDEPERGKTANRRTWPEIYKQICNKFGYNPDRRAKYSNYHGEMMECHLLIQEMKSPNNITDKDLIPQLKMSQARMSMAFSRISKEQSNCWEIQHLLTAYNLAAAYINFKQKGKALYYDKFSVPKKEGGDTYEYNNMLKISGTCKNLSIQKVWERLMLFAEKENLSFRCVLTLIPFFFHSEETSDALTDIAKTNKTPTSFVRAMAEYAGTAILAEAKMELQTAKRKAGEPLITAFRRVQRHIATVVQEMPTTSREYHRIDKEAKALLAMVSPKLQPKIRQKLRSHQQAGGDMDILKLAKYAEEQEQAQEYLEPADRGLEVHIQAMDLPSQRFRTTFEEEEPMEADSTSNNRTEQKSRNLQEENGYQQGRRDRSRQRGDSWSDSNSHRNHEGGEARRDWSENRQRQSRRDHYDNSGHNRQQHSYNNQRPGSNRGGGSNSYTQGGSSGYNSSSSSAPTTGYNSSYSNNRGPSRGNNNSMNRAQSRSNSYNNGGANRRYTQSPQRQGFGHNHQQQPGPYKDSNWHYGRSPSGERQRMKTTTQSLPQQPYYNQNYQQGGNQHQQQSRGYYNKGEPPQGWQQYQQTQNGQVGSPPWNDWNQHRWQQPQQPPQYGQPPPQPHNQQHPAQQLQEPQQQHFMQQLPQQQQSLSQPPQARPAVVQQGYHSSHSGGTATPRTAAQQQDTTKLLKEIASIMAKDKRPESRRSSLSRETPRDALKPPMRSADSSSSSSEAQARRKAARAARAADSSPYGTKRDRSDSVGSVTKQKTLDNG